MIPAQDERYREGYQDGWRKGRAAADGALEYQLRYVAQLERQSRDLSKLASTYANHHYGFAAMRAALLAADNALSVLVVLIEDDKGYDPEVLLPVLREAKKRAADSLSIWKNL